MAESNAAIVCVTETWFDDLVMDSEIEHLYMSYRERIVNDHAEVCVCISIFNPRQELSTRDFVDRNSFIQNKTNFSMCVL